MKLQEKLVLYGFTMLVFCMISFQMGRYVASNEAVKWVEQICKAVR